MLPVARDCGKSGEVGDSTANPRNMNVRTSTWRSVRSLANTTITCLHFSCSSAASSKAMNASREPSGNICGGNAMKSVFPCKTASQGWRAVRKVSRSGGAPLVCPGASGPPQRPCSQRHVVTIGLACAVSRSFTAQHEITLAVTTAALY